MDILDDIGVSKLSAKVFFFKSELTPGALWSTFMMDGCTFLSFELIVAIHCHYKTQRLRVFINITT